MDNQDTAPTRILCEGSKFSSLEALHESIAICEKSNFIQLYIRSSRTIENAAKRATNKPFNKSLKYVEINYHCIHEGRKRKKSSTNQRLNQRYMVA